MTEKIFSPPNHCLRFLFLVALFSARAFLLHLSKRLCHVFELIPNIKAYVDRRGLLSRHRDTIARPRIDLDDLLLFQLVLCAEDKSRKIGSALEIVDDYPFDLRSEGSQDVREQIMGERSLLLRALLEHRDRHPNALLNVNHENLVLMPRKTAQAPLVAARPRICTSITGLLILQVSSSPSRSSRTKKILLEDMKQVAQSLGVSVLTLYRWLPASA